MAGKKKKKEPEKQGLERISVCRNRKARHNYEILDTIECGMVLYGSEVKTLRTGKASLDEAFGRVRNGELWLLDADIPEYPQANLMNHIPKRDRKLLLKRKEIEKFAEPAMQQGLTLVALEIYFIRGYAKVKMAIGRGRKDHDKREKLKKQSATREMRQAKLN